MTPNAKPSSGVHKSRAPPSAANRTSARSFGSEKDTAIHKPSDQALRTPSILAVTNRGRRDLPKDLIQPALLVLSDENHAENATLMSKKTGRGRPRKQTAMPSSSRIVAPVKRSESTKGKTPQKRPRGRPPKRAIDNSARPAKKERNPRVAKSRSWTEKRKKLRGLPEAASTHGMRTRTRGPAESLRLL